MKHFSKLIGAVAAAVLAGALIACDNGNAAESNSTQNPFAGTVWEQDLEKNEQTPNTGMTLVFSATGNKVTMTTVISSLKTETELVYKIEDSNTAFLYIDYGNGTIVDGYTFTISESDANKAELKYPTTGMIFDFVKK